MKLYTLPEVQAHYSLTNGQFALLFSYGLFPTVEVEGRAFVRSDSLRSLEYVRGLLAQAPLPLLFADPCEVP